MLKALKSCPKCKKSPNLGTLLLSNKLISVPFQQRFIFTVCSKTFPTRNWPLKLLLSLCVATACLPGSQTYFIAIYIKFMALQKVVTAFAKTVSKTVSKTSFFSRRSYSPLSSENKRLLKDIFNPYFIGNIQCLHSIQ